ncbi:HAMP domain-containing sensor histidine kinase [Lysinibacillus fusiformis]|uniref:HAMP domain-containing sensor histidine kinase n=1 Tax=Lysinibacillus fusiformis TaxID=28031 RepID=UPI00215A76AA|nr:HAMP domain-containing sensor histidine kinase [Lysinibacillus fusiformis]MCR8851797.1 HAMP domain-containing histidine kinase [Lysinibacillus fusiformis]
MYLKNWINKWIWMLIICVGLLFIGTLALFFATHKSQEVSEDQYVINQIRLSVNQLLLYIEDHFSILERDSEIRSKLQQMSDDQEIEITVLHLDGKVMFHSIEKDVTSTIQIKNDIHYDLFTSQQEPGKINIAFPIVNDVSHEQIGNAIFSLNKDSLFPSKPNSNYFFLVILMGALSFFIICLALYMNRKVQKDILTPLHELKKNTEEIIKGSYEQMSSYPKLDELGELYAVFDQMRLEIKQLVILQNEQEQNQKKLISSISHDVRTPLTTIKAYLDAISEGVCRNEDSLMSYIHIMQTNTEKMSRLIDDLFIHALKELGHIPIHLNEQYSRDVLTNILQPIQYYVQTTNIHFIKPAMIPNVLIQVDEGRLEQVISNLVTNALKHTSNGDTITITTYIENQTLYIQVIDNGNGMLPEDMPFIFERYFRGHQPERESAIKNEGAGLGLSICQHIMEEHYGSISFHSKHKEGTTFTLTLPIS